MIVKSIISVMRDKQEVRSFSFEAKSEAEINFILDKKTVA